MDDVTRATGGARIENCPHAANRRTLHWQGDYYLAACAKCHRRIEGPLRCSDCGADKVELRRRDGAQRIRSYNGRDLCVGCRDRHQREADDRERWYEQQRREREAAVRLRGEGPAHEDVLEDHDDAGDR